MKIKCDNDRVSRIKGGIVNDREDYIEFELHFVDGVSEEDFSQEIAIEIARSNDHFSVVGNMISDDVELVDIESEE